MSEKSKVDCGRRRLVAAAVAASGAGVVAAAVPFVSGMQPSAQARAARFPVEADISGLLPGQVMTVDWCGKPVWIFRRSPEMLDTLSGLDGRLADPRSEAKQQPDSCRNPARSIKSDLLVAVGLCTHLGCAPAAKFRKGTEEGMPADWPGGFVCACHGSAFDFAGRVFRGGVASRNLEIPPHAYLSETRILIGENTAEAA